MLRPALARRALAPARALTVALARGARRAPARAARRLLSSLGGGLAGGDASSVFFSAAAPVALAPGEVLVAENGASTLRTYVVSWVASFFFSLNLGVAVSLEALLPVEPLSPLVKAAAGVLAVGAVAMSRAQSRCLVRAAVLEADGARLRVYPYGAFFRPGAPVSIPLPLLRESEAPRAAADADAVYAAVLAGARGAPSRAHLVFDKPPAAPRGGGSGLAFSERGLAAGASSALPATPAAAAAFKRFVLLVWLLRGNAVADMPRLRAGDWEAESISEQLGARGAGAAGAAPARAAAALRRAYWRRATDAATGREYWYDELTWDTSFSPPADAV